MAKTNLLGERTRQLKSVNGCEIWKCWGGAYGTIYDVCEPDGGHYLDSFKTLVEAHEFARAYKRK